MIVCERCGYQFDPEPRSGFCPVCDLNIMDDWPCSREEWEAYHLEPGDVYPDAAICDAWRAEATRRTNVEQGRQPSLFGLGT